MRADLVAVKSEAHWPAADEGNRKLLERQVQIQEEHLQLAKQQAGQRGGLQVGRQHLSRRFSFGRRWPTEGRGIRQSGLIRLAPR